MNGQNYVDFFEDIARKNKKIAHSDTRKQFSTYQPEDIMQLGRYELKLRNWCMCLEWYTLNLRKNGSGQFRDLYPGGFLLLKVPSDLNSIDQHQNEAETLARQIWARIYKMQYNQNGYLKIQGRPYKFDDTNFEIYRVRGLTENAAGVRVEFTLAGQTTFCEEYDQEQWLDL
ncbi:hypothetical protein [Siphonobacter sp. SORGH_AS_0500]|uniref:hypothetical protein n=1 Tax=Siphonobacter sp. SORGH_AS_0500 TaxID=1864824 RepID=UPI00285F6BCA|nr:hypothetical protein [Siphonobacter sp. SORGH_AS_0500]MDR6196144.1 hypothetical protein [Siphonobacter sp. SORGH_AS_0500]